MKRYFKSYGLDRNSSGVSLSTALDVDRVPRRHWSTFCGPVATIWIKARPALASGTVELLAAIDTQKDVSLILFGNSKGCCMNRRYVRSFRAGGNSDFGNDPLFTAPKAYHKSRKGIQVKSARSGARTRHQIGLFTAGDDAVFRPERNLAPQLTPATFTRNRRLKIKTAKSRIPLNFEVFGFWYFGG